MTNGKGISWLLKLETPDLEVSISHPGIIKTWRRRRETGQEEQNPSPFKVAGGSPLHNSAGEGQVPAPGLRPQLLWCPGLCPSLPVTVISQLISVVMKKWDIKY